MPLPRGYVCGLHHKRGADTRENGKSLVHQKTAAELDGAAEQITLRLLVSNAKLTEIDVAVH